MPDTLTPGEVRCLRLVGEELSNKAIARRLGVSAKTVSNHLTSAYAKLGIADRGSAKRREAALIVAREYPDISRIPPIPMATLAEKPLGGRAPGDALSGDSETTNTSWMLPPPPRRALHLIGLILVSAAVAGIITAGLVQLVAGGMETLSTAAPPSAVRALDQPPPSRTT